MNTRYGWGEPAEPGDQWSELVDQEFFANFFVDGMYNLGVAYMMAKDDFVSLIPTDTHYDWIAKSNTLFGDPELPMYSSVPLEMETGSIFLAEGDQNLYVSVTSGGAPLVDARVCLLQGEWDAPVTYAVGITDASGSVTLSWADPMPGSPDEARVTVWARDHVLLTGMHMVGNMGTGGGSQQTIPTLYMNSSNPVSGTASLAWSLPGSTTGKIAIVDLAGRVVTHQELQGVQGVFNWQAHENPAGIYFARLITSTGQIDRQYRIDLNSGYVSLQGDSLKGESWTFTPAWSQRPGSVSGTVSGTGAAVVTMVVAPAGSDGEIQTAVFAPGAYSFAEVPGGRYTVSVFVDGNSDSTWNPGEPYGAWPGVVEVFPGIETEGINIQVVP